MYKITTPTRIAENVSLWPSTSVTGNYCDEALDGLLKGFSPEVRDRFVIKPRKGVSKAKPIVSISVEKPLLEKTLEKASPEEVQKAEENNKAEELLVAVKRKSIDLFGEMEAWFGTLKSPKTQETYRSRINTHFLPYCTKEKIDPRMMGIKEARVFVVNMKATHSNPVVRSTISAVKGLFTALFENHGIPPHTNPFNPKSFFPAKIRVKRLIVPNEAETDAILAFAEKEDPTVFAALTLIYRHGCRRGAFHGMKEKGGKVVTKSKGKSHSFYFDESEVELLKAHSLEQYTPEQLGNKINYLLKKAYEKGAVLEVYSAHDFRHAFAMNFYNKTRDIAELSGKLGHSQISTTETYLESRLKKESL